MWNYESKGLAVSAYELSEFVEKQERFIQEVLNGNTTLVYHHEWAVRTAANVNGDEWNTCSGNICADNGRAGIQLNDGQNNFAPGAWQCSCCAGSALVFALSPRLPYHDLNESEMMP